MYSCLSALAESFSGIWFSWKFYRLVCAIVEHCHEWENVRMKSRGRCQGHWPRYTCMSYITTFYTPMMEYFLSLVTKIKLGTNTIVEFLDCDNIGSLSWSTDDNDKTIQPTEKRFPIRQLRLVRKNLPKWILFLYCLGQNLNPRADLNY